MSLFYREAELEKSRQQARDLLATNLGLVGGDKAKHALNELQG
ncbi:hypothetical protein [Ectopseudomonas oleovorans]|nr:hypothetical protein [Pseudomonas oleovorans]